MTNPRAMLFILAGVRPEFEDEFNLWYDREHLPDRVTVPGFITARRHAAAEGALWPYLALYETADISVFSSAPYKERLANQSDWSRRMLPVFVDPQRNIALRRAQVGEGIGSSTILAALRPAEGQEDALVSAFSRSATELRENDPSVVAVGLYASDPVLSRPVAEYPPVAASPVRGSDWFVMADIIGNAGGAGLDAALAALPLAEPPVMIGRYIFRSSVSASDMATDAPPL
ncbi:MAG: hypothetical protein KF887_03650 [Paracoccaceae bacterium]|nr:MAG: hypothetical protein KF887_03650 [Paracoccaceae bacterium]